MNSRLIYFVAGAFAIATCVFGYLYYQEIQNTSGIDITIGGDKLSIETK